MPIVETTITVSIPEGGATLAELDLEVVVARAVEEAGRRLLRAACLEVEEQELRRLRRRVQQVKVRPLDMLTRFSWVRRQGGDVWEADDVARSLPSITGLSVSSLE